MSGVELYDNTARSLSGLDSSLQSRGTSDGIVDVKLRKCFEDAKKGMQKNKKRYQPASYGDKRLLTPYVRNVLW